MASGRAFAVIDIPAASQVHRQVVRKALQASPVAVDPRFSMHYIDFTKDDLESGRSATELVASALTEQHNRSMAGTEPAFLRAVHRAIEAR